MFPAVYFLRPKHRTLKSICNYDRQSSCTWHEQDRLCVCVTARTCLYSGPRQSTRTRCLQVGITFLANKTTPHEFSSTHDKTLRSHVGVKLQNTASDRSHFIIHTSRHQPTVAPRPLPVHPSRQEVLQLVQIILPKKQVVEKRATTSLAPTILCFRWEIPAEDCMYPGNPPHLISPPSPLPPCL